MIETKAVFRRKDPKIEAVDCVVDKVIRLPGAEYDSFSHNLLREWDFIRDNPIETVVDAQGRHHCLLVLGEGRADGILVNPEGAAYARYSALLPGAHAMDAADRYPYLAERTQQLTRAADFVVFAALEPWPEGANVEDPAKYAVSFRTLSEKFGVSFDPYDSLTDIFITMLNERPEIELVRCNTEEFLINAAHPEIAPNIKQKKDENVASAEHIEKEFAAWANQSAGIDGHWREDRRYRQYKDGVLYYIGGEDGQYMRIANDGLLTVGRYELARSGIEDAVLSSRVWKQYENYEQAFLCASQLAGLRFTNDLFGEKPSVLAQIREARKNPQPHAPKKDWGKDKSELGL